MADNNSPWGPKGGSGDKGNSPWGSGKRPGSTGGPDRSADLDNVIEGFKTRVKKPGGPRRPGGGGGGGGNIGDFRIGPLGPLGIALAVGAVLLLSTSVYTVDQTERALVLRFGDYERTALPGLNFKLPSPIETTYKQETEIIRRDDIGGNDFASLMLTGDENIVDIDFTVLWRINDLANYFFEVDDPAQAVRAVAESAMREVVGQSELQLIITTDRLAITTAVRDLMQETLDEYKAGVRVVEVQLQKADAPDQGGVVDAFRDVEDAGQEAETTINQAVASQNTIVPEARGQAAQILQDAQAYRDRVIAEAEGEAERFNLIYEEYRKAPVVTRQRMYLETIEDVYGSGDTIILDDNAGSGVVPYLPLDQLSNRNNPPRTGGQ
ncbi:FtsH protease activity modulator HflK [uncultured Algimonas sp.]|uniref:FtsH protease activity modulator HflK n=1 Tax=uncultured Algimonas sp. TaxID=1547920 RepID=UPI0026138318|nr:FtsH protease activity modulator HflK [uncultured Algimonas sp.]